MRKSARIGIVLGLLSGCQTDVGVTSMPTEPSVETASSNFTEKSEKIHVPIPHLRPHIDISPSRSNKDISALKNTQAQCEYKVALTFDDGSGPCSERLLDILDENKGAATFFVVGERIERHPEFLQRMINEVHEIGNHTWSHPDLTKLSLSEINSQITRTDEAIQSVTGAVPMTFIPPYGALTQRVRGQIQHPIILWTHDTLDWKNKQIHSVVMRATDRTQYGSIILMHDIHKNTVDSVENII